jgi:hypothetical protein
VNGELQSRAFRREAPIRLGAPCLAVHHAGLRLIDLGSMEIATNAKINSVVIAS